MDKQWLNKKRRQKEIEPEKNTEIKDKEKTSVVDRVKNFTKYKMNHILTAVNNLPLSLQTIKGKNDNKKGVDKVNESRREFLKNIGKLGIATIGTTILSGTPFEAFGNNKPFEWKEVIKKKCISYKEDIINYVLDDDGIEDFIESDDYIKLTLKYILNGKTEKKEIYIQKNNSVSTYQIKDKNGVSHTIDFNYYFHFEGKYYKYNNYNLVEVYENAIDPANKDMVIKLTDKKFDPSSITAINDSQLRAMSADEIATKGRLFGVLNEHAEFIKKVKNGWLLDIEDETYDKNKEQEKHTYVDVKELIIEHRKGGNYYKPHDKSCANTGSWKTARNSKREKDIRSTGKTPETITNYNDLLNHTEFNPYNLTEGEIKLPNGDFPKIVLGPGDYLKKLDKDYILTLQTVNGIRQVVVEKGSVVIAKKLLNGNGDPCIDIFYALLNCVNTIMDYYSVKGMSTKLGLGE